jgi:hypothetical protein
MRGAWLAVLLSAAASADAEVVFVTDSLRLPVHEAKGATEAPFETLASGTALEVLERKATDARVRLPDGREGWVDATYLVPLGHEPRAAHDVRAEVERLEAENRAYGERLARYRTTLPLGWVLLAVTLAGAAGFASGLWWLDAAIRRRHGGFRVY